MTAHLNPQFIMGLHRRLLSFGCDPYNSYHADEIYHRCERLPPTFTRAQMDYAFKAAVGIFLSGEPAERVDMHRRLPQ